MATFADHLTERQKAAAEVERKMLETLMNFTPAETLRISDAQYIARMASTHAFDEFSKAWVGER